MNVQNQRAMQKVISSSTVIQYSYNGKNYNHPKTVFQTHNSLLQKGSPSCTEVKKKKKANWDRPIINRYSIYLMNTHAMFKECKPKMHHYVEQAFFSSKAKFLVKLIPEMVT